MSPMAFDVGLRQIVIEERIVLELGELELVRVKVECFLENAEGFLFVENPNSDEIADLQYETLSFLYKDGLSFVDLLPEGENLSLGGELLGQFAEGLFWVFAQHRECLGDF